MTEVVQNVPADEWALGEDIRNERRLEQDRLWSQAVADGRVHLSHREFALKYGPRFVSAIHDYQIIRWIILEMYSPQSLFQKLSIELITIISEYAFPGQGPLARAIIAQLQKEKELNDFYHTNENKLALSPFRICLRKRMLFDWELAEGAYETCFKVTDHSILLHEGKLARNGRLLSMTHHEYSFDRIFDETTNNEEVCQDVVDPLLHWVEQGHDSTLVCFGQTGTGKTYTLNGALEHISTKLLGKSIRILFYEVHGNKCYDLLNHRHVVHLRFDHQEKLCVRGAKTIELYNLTQPNELYLVLQEAMSLRSSLATERNPFSSRSHAVCKIELLVPSPPQPPQTKKPVSLADYLQHQKQEKKEVGEKVSESTEDEEDTKENDPYSYSNSSPMMGVGTITLVDLAGSERNYETTKMSAVQHKESADINLALMSLKDCFRALHNILLADESTKNTNQPLIRIPYRASTLTKVLKSCFTSGNLHHTTIIATISPSPVDIQHSINTIKHVLLMSTKLSEYIGQVTVEVPKSPHSALSDVPVYLWSDLQVLAWLANVERGRFAHLVLPRGIDGKGLLQLTPQNLSAMFEEQERQGRQELEGPTWVISTEGRSSIGLALYNAVHRELIKQKIMI